MKKARGLALLAVVMALGPPTVLQADPMKHIFVNVNRPDDNGDGLTWTTAKKTLQAGIDTARPLHDPPDEVWVARGLYTLPSQGSSFELELGVYVYGGLAGDENPATFDLSDRDFQANETILSGELGAPGLDGNCWVVVKGKSGDTSGLLDGVSITAAAQSAISCNNSSPWLRNLFVHSNRSEGNGAALRCENGGSPRIRVCTFYANAASGQGGAIKSESGCTPTVEDSLLVANECNSSGGAVSSAGTSTFLRCTFFSNRCWGSSSNGGAIRSASALTVRDCTFEGNVSEYGNGGAISGDGTGGTATVKVFTSRFTGNAARNGKNGGAIKLGDSPVQIVNCVFESNTAPAGKGGAVFDGTDTGGGTGFTGFNYLLTIVNCLFHGNGASLGGGFYSDGRAQTASAVVNCTIVHNYAASSGAGVYLASPTQKPVITNCIAWDNHVGASVNETAQIGWGSGGMPNVTYTC